MDSWVPFTSAYGIQDSAVTSTEIHWAARHVPFHGAVELSAGPPHKYVTTGAACPPADHDRYFRIRCRCSGTFDGRERDQCCQEMTAEDLRCDHCRKYCWGVNNAQERVDFPLVTG